MELIVTGVAQGGQAWVPLAGSRVQLEDCVSVWTLVIRKLRNCNEFSGTDYFHERHMNADSHLFRVLIILPAELPLTVCKDLLKA